MHTTDIERQARRDVLALLAQEERGEGPRDPEEWAGEAWVQSLTARTIPTRELAASWRAYRRSFRAALARTRRLLGR